MSGDCVHDAADRVAAVKQSRRPFDDLDSFDGQNIDGFGVIARFETESTGAIAVLQDEHAIAIKTANDRPGGAGSEASFRDAEFAVKCFAERHRTLLCELDRAEHVNGLNGAAERLVRSRLR